MDGSAKEMPINASDATEIWHSDRFELTDVTSQSWLEQFPI
jgi:hypothetical protein